jgi:hypothetical protein
MENTKEIINTIYEMAKNREIHPCGAFDKAKRWQPCDVLEGYMGSVRTPSRSYPFSYMIHCRTKKYITTMVTESNIKTIEEAINLYTKGSLAQEINKSD